MVRTSAAKPSDTLAEWTAVRDEARLRRACDLWRPATQTMFGEGPVHTPLMFVGEQPGDKEDIAGRILDRALEDTGIGSISLA